MRLLSLLLGLQYKPPTTDCPDCRMVEGGLVEKLRYYRREFFPTTAEQIHALAHFHSGMVRAMIGGDLPLTPYELHKRRYIETGDIEELARMARHIEPVDN